MQGALFGHQRSSTGCRRQVDAIAPQKIVHSDFNVAHSGGARRHGYTNLAQLFEIIEQRLRERGERKLVYAYSPELDSVAHEYGVGEPAGGGVAAPLRRGLCAPAFCAAGMRRDGSGDR